MGTFHPFGSEPTTPLPKDTSATLAVQWVCNAVLQKNLEIPFILLSYHNIIQKSDTGWLLFPRNEDEIKKKATQSLRSLSIESDSKQPNTNK